MRHSIVCLAAAALVVAMSPCVVRAAHFAAGTTYVTRVLSAAPLVLEYTLSAETAPAPIDFAAMELEGSATLVYAWKRNEAFLYSPTVDIEATGDYSWSYAPFNSNLPEAAILGVSGGEPSAPVVFPYASYAAGPHGMHTRFVVRFAPGVDAVDAADVNLQVVHFSETGAPYIDVYRPAPDIR